MFEKEGMHLYFENVDVEISRFIENELGTRPSSSHERPLDLLVFLSKHRSEKNVRSLTVHPPGNYLSADFGGQQGYLPPSAPFQMTSALRSLYKEKKALGLKDQTTYEVTHHGPALSSPSFFIEIGSSEERWHIPELGRAIALALLSSDFREPDTLSPIAIGIGGGHYAPRFTDRAMRKKFAFGHMIPDYILKATNDMEKCIDLAIGSTPDVEYAFMHRSKTNEDILDQASEILVSRGIKVAY